MNFTFDEATSMVSGPAEYMKEAGSELLSNINSGQDEIFNMTANLSPDVITAVLVRLQTDYAGWIGNKQLLASLK